MRGLKAAVLAGLCLVAGSSFGADLQLTKEQEDKANELGAVASPVAFLSSCEMSMAPLTAEEAKEMEKASEDEKSAYQAMKAMGQVVCAGMITAVAETLLVADNYKTKSGDRICVDPRQSVQGILIKMHEIAENEPSVFHSTDMTTPTFILYTLKQLGPCAK